MRLLALLLALMALGPVPAAAQLEGVLAAPAESPTPAPSAAEQTIADTQDEGADGRIAQRIRGIFAELPAYAGVEVAVSQGVVSLSGTVPEADDIARAEAIAGRVSGVVTVDNALERDLSVSASAGTLGALRAQLENLVKILPLLGVAIAVAAIIALVGYGIAGLTGLWHRIAPNSFLAELIASAVRFAFVLAGVVVALNMVGAGTLLGAVLGGAGVIGIALGFAMRDTIENYVASLMLSLRQPFRANDWVQIDAYEGRIIRLTSRATVLMTLDGNHLRIPNSQVFKAVILNFTRNPQRRFQFDLGVDADDDALAARRLGRDTLATLPFVLDDPRPEGRVIEVGDSNVVIRFLGWIDQRESDWWKTQSLAIVAVKSALENAGFGLPEPIYRLRFDPRSASVPFENMAEGRARPASPPAPPPKPSASASELHEDVRPADEVKDMVEAERAAAGAGEKDLLDHARPVE
ncbi:mechanosensitive ion channel family protein [Qipengyuania sp.]|uniref:mechanosensitive ion channel family protein n=1 Tax=Qipengyuania sp. TaxID=2004515 RepID=UPI0035C7EDC3